MATLSRVVRLDEFDNYCLRGKEVLCAHTFAVLMNEKELPGKIRVTISTKAIRGAARVPVRISGWDDWIDWTGKGGLLHRSALHYLRELGVPEGKWTDVWVDWAPV